MPVSPASKPTHSNVSLFEIKSAQLPLVALLVKTQAWDATVADLLSLYGAQGENPDFFDHDALVLDFSLLTDLPNQADQISHALSSLVVALKNCRLHPVAIRGANEAWQQVATQMGLITSAEPIRPKAKAPVRDAATVEPEPLVAPPKARSALSNATMVIDKPLRSGQKVYARGGDLVVLAMVNQGAEVVADGNIHVYAPLRGKAMAGASGNTQARIFSTSLEPELVAIAGVYRTSENSFGADVLGKPAQVRLSTDGQEKLLIEALKS